MSILVVRHGLSYANQSGSPAFRSPEAPLTWLGREQARYVGRVLARDHGIEVSQTPVGVSEFHRAQETADMAGFQRGREYTSLNEISHNLSKSEWRAMIAAGRLPDNALEEAETRLETPFTEKVLFSHGLLIACMCVVLGVPQGKSLIPSFCEVRELPIEAL